MFYGHLSKLRKDLPIQKLTNFNNKFHSFLQNKTASFTKILCILGPDPYGSLKTAELYNYKSDVKSH